ncbi:hypothetical protein HD806DRAFT_489165 [Xylariaceae sp. AK1471]|nr:hypothetical protein HD806DRAFT_489165 [Xylariaceae sp. AK1471]
MASNTDSDALAANLARAKEYYSKKKYSKAAAIFKQVASCCVCGVQAKTSPCLCKSLVRAIENGTVDDELRKKCICSAKSNVRCKSANHVDALDGLAAIHEAKGLVDVAIVNAEAMINLAPREPKGFLRLGKLLRLQGSYRTAFLTYQQGIELVKKKNPSHELLPVLHQVKDKIRFRAFATDPLKALPIELIAMIFENLGLRSLCRCLQVSKSWKALLTNGDKTMQSLWRVQHFGPCKKFVRLAHLQRYATYSGSQVTELVIGDCRQFGMDSYKLKWIVTSCRSLRVLKLQAPSDMEQGLVDLAMNPCLPRLTSLYLGFHVPVMKGFLHQIVTSSAETLQELSILNLPDCFVQEDAKWPVLKNLRTLRLGRASWKMIARVDLSPFMRTSPNIEEVWLQNISVHFSPLTELDPWPRLKRVFLGESVEWPLLLEHGLPFCLSSEIEELHVRSHTSGLALLRRPLEQDPDTYPEPKNLQKFSVDYQLFMVDPHYPEELQRWIRPGLESGSLKELGLGAYPRRHLDWLRSDHLTFLSIRGLSLQVGTDPHVIDEAFFDLIGRFPNLVALDISKEPISNGALGKAIQRGIKTVYHRGGYYEKAEVRRWARKEHNAQIIEGDYDRTLPINSHL